MTAARQEPVKRKPLRILPGDDDVDGTDHMNRSPNLDEYDGADEDLTLAGMMFHDFYDPRDGVDPFVLRKCRAANKPLQGKRRAE